MRVELQARVRETPQTSCCLRGLGCPLERVLSGGGRRLVSQSVSHSLIHRHHLVDSATAGVKK